MKRILLTIVTAFCFVTLSFGQNGSDQAVDFQIVAQDDISTPIYRTPAVIPVCGYYVASVCCLNLFFSQDIGTVDVHIENISTGEHYSDSASTDNGVQLIPIGSNSGFYVITISISGVPQYYAELVI